MTIEVLMNGHQKVDAKESHEVSIHLLGGFHVERFGIEVPESAWQQRRAAKTLIKLLATCSDHSLHREQIIEILWPDLELESAFNSFAKGLHVARRAIEPQLQPHCLSSFLTLRHDVLTLDTQRVWIDADNFQIAAKSAMAAGGIAALQAVLPLYKGELLPEDRYEEWTFSRRDAFVDQYTDIVIALSDALEQQHAFSAAIEHLQQLLEREPGREEVHQRLMRLYALSGSRRLALRQYQVCRDALQRELDTNPSTETEVLRDDILSERIVTRRAHDLSASVSPAELPESPPVYRSTLSPFVGRDRAFELLLSDLASAEQGRGGVALISGEPGIGKSRLAAELSLEATRRGDLVLWGTSYEQESDFPYGELIEALEHHFAHCTPTTRSSFAAQYPQLTYLIPSLEAESNPDIWGHQPELPSSQIFSAVVRLLTNFASSRTVVLVLDNMHLASTSSLHFLHQLARLAVQRRWLIVATYRAEEVAAGSQFQRLSVALTQEGLCRRFDLRAITRQTADRLTEALLPGGNPSRSLLDRVYELAVGNPLFIQELVLSLKDKDELILSGGEWFAPEAIRVPEKIRDLVRVRVDAKKEHVRQVLALAATAGSEVSFDFLRMAAARALNPAVTDADLLDILDDALETGILEERDSRYSFRYPLYRAALSEHLSDHRRAHFHEVLAQIGSQTG